MTLKETLHLTNPLMQGPNVRHLENLLVAHGRLRKDQIDSKFGPADAHAVVMAKRFDIGYPENMCLPIAGPKLIQYLERPHTIPPHWAARAKSRQEYQQHHSGEAIEARKRKLIVEYLLWGIAHEPQIHYAQTRPMDMVYLWKLPVYNDCSEFYTKACKAAGIPDPNELHYDGEGFTGTLIQGMRHITKAMAQPGDAVVWGAYPGHHVAGVLTGGIDPMLSSHGSEGGPRRISFSQESKYQPNTVYWLTPKRWQ